MTWIATKTSFRKLCGKADYQRWSNYGSLSPDWNSRTEKISRLISPGASVLEFGAGRMALKKYLAAGCTYTPSGLVSRGDGTIVCDLNAPELPVFSPHDFAVFSGLLEYVNNVRAVISHIGQFVETIIVSYAVRECVSKD